MFCCFGEFYNWEVLSLWGVWSFVISGNFMIGDCFVFWRIVYYRKLSWLSDAKLEYFVIWGNFVTVKSCLYREMLLWESCCCLGEFYRRKALSHVGIVGKVFTFCGILSWESFVTLRYFISWIGCTQTAWLLSLLRFALKFD